MNAIIRFPVLLCLTSTLLMACSTHDPLPQRQSDAPLLETVVQQNLSTSSRAPLPEADVEQALLHYQQAFLHQPSPEILRRMADLSLQAVEHQLQEEEPLKGFAQSHYGQYLGLHRYPKQPQLAFTHSGVGQQELKVLQEAPIEANVYTAAFLYHTLLHFPLTHSQRAEALYRLAHTYSLAAEEELSLEALTRLVDDHPQSPFYVEAQFRRGEILFQQEALAQAAEAYAAVIKVPDSEFYQQSLYKLGWSLYQQEKFTDALPLFFSLYDSFLNEAPTDSEEASLVQTLKEDTQRVISLTLMALQGPSTAQQWFKQHPNKPYEAAVYEHLGEAYLQQQDYALAAESFQRYATQYPTHLKAPYFSQKAIDAYAKGGLQQEYLAAKKHYVNQYGVNSPFWRAHTVQRSTITPQLTEHIFHIAQHYHQRGQQTNKQAYYLTASHWYDQYLLTAPPSPANADIAHWQAQALHQAGHIQAAIKAYEFSAYTWPEHSHSAQVAYESVRLRQAYYEGLSAPAHKQQWRQANLKAALTYAQQFPSHVQVNPVLVNTIETQLAAGALPEAISAAEALLTHQPEDDLAIYALSTMANAYLDLQQYAEAEAHYEQLLRHPLSAEDTAEAEEKLALSLYRQADALASEAQWQQAAEGFLRVVERTPHTSIRPIAQYEAATLYLNASEYQAAIPLLKALRQQFPHHEQSATVPDKLALAYESTEQYGLAAQEYAFLAQRFQEEDPELSREALWRAVELEQKSGDTTALRKRLNTYIHTWSSPLLPLAEAQYLLANTYGENAPERQPLLEALSAHLAKAPEDDRIAWLAGWAALALAQQSTEEFTQLPLKQPLAQHLNAKVAAMRRSLAHYQVALDTGVSEHVTEAQYQVGWLYETLAEDLMNSERPAGLDALELELYELDLEDRALPYEDRAIDYYLANTALVPDGIYNTAIRQSYAGLARLLPGRYHKPLQVSPYVDVIY